MHQFDPERYVVGGIDGFIRDVISVGAGAHHLRVIGVTSPDSGRQLGVQIRLRTSSGAEIDFLPVAALRSGDQSRRIPHSLRLVAGLARYRPDLGSDIVHIHRADVAVAARRLFRGSLLRVLFVHGSSKEALANRMETQWRFAPHLSAIVERAAVRDADLGYVMHGNATIELTAINPRVHHGRNWFDDAVFRPPSARPAKPPVRILWAGRLEPQKDPELALAAVAELVARGVEVEVQFAGDGTLRGPLLNRIHDLDLADRACLSGSLSAHQLAMAMRRSHVLLLSSRWEGIPRIVLESLASGLPVVSTNAGDVAQMLSPEAGVVVDDRDPSYLADAVQHLLEAETSPSRVAASVSPSRASIVVPNLFDEIEAAAAMAVSR